MDALHGAGPVRLLQLILDHRRVRALVACVHDVVWEVETASMCVWCGLALLPFHASLSSSPSPPIPLTFNNDAVDAQGRVRAHHPTTSPCQAPPSSSGGGGM